MSAQGDLRPGRAALWPRLRGLLDRIDWLTLTRAAPALLLDNRAERRRVAARDTLGGVVPCFSQLLPLDFGLTHVPHADDDELARWEAGLAGVLDSVGLDADRASTSSMPNLDPYDVVVVPTMQAIEPAAWAALTEAASRGCAVAAGPRWPALDDRLRPHPFDPGSIRLLDGPDELAALLPGPPVTRDRPEVDLHVWHGEGRTVLAAFNSSPREVTTTLSGFRGHTRLDGLWNAERREGDGAVDVRLGPWGAQVWTVTPELEAIRQRNVALLPQVPGFGGGGA